MEKTTEKILPYPRRTRFVHPNKARAAITPPFPIKTMHLRISACLRSVSLLPVNQVGLRSFGNSVFGFPRIPRISCFTSPIHRTKSDQIGVNRTIFSLICLPVTAVIRVPVCAFGVASVSMKSPLPRLLLYGNSSRRASAFAPFCITLHHFPDYSAYQACPNLRFQFFQESLLALR
jgi:hypothetical protein